MTETLDTPRKTLSQKEVLKILPHRYPFLLVDKILDVNLEEKYIIGQKNLTMNEHFFQGHFPDHPIMPGVLILEALAQAGGVLIHLLGHTDKTAVLLNMNTVKFRKSVHPGDSLILKSEAQHVTSKGGRFTAKAYVEDKLVTEAEISFVLVDKEAI